MIYGCYNWSKVVVLVLLKYSYIFIILIIRKILIQRWQILSISEQVHLCLKLVAKSGTCEKAKKSSDAKLSVAL